MTNDIGGTNPFGGYIPAASMALREGLGRRALGGDAPFLL
jgi:hypothetical protein